ncbi:endonuclease/exonuclease/phosphatase family protein [Polycladidibacter hongkongensis]|uniref:endonuclease/exonuclease/phosphatase family protein n=1 Tax=Polycladidibacter hongkongensis TaxID=1647556 RepID=UPI0008330A56|nr:endonuclease/exonuclease/phosphatase family protein [Pseudovibrio hongkongensis]
MNRLLYSLSFLLLIASQAYGQPVTIMAYNVENLFDATDDTGNPRDDTFLSLSDKQQRGAAHRQACLEYNEEGSRYFKECMELDWSPATYASKLASLRKVFASFAPAPQVIVVPETENRQVLEDLVDGSLAAKGYNTIVQLDTSDEPQSRGIDVGMVASLPLTGSPQAIKVFDAAHPAPQDCRPTRDILKAQFELPGGEGLTVFGVHFPAGRGYECRKAAMRVLNAEVAKLPTGALAVAAGDFNFNCDDLKNGEFQALAKAGGWLFPPEIAGCRAPGSSFYGRNQTWSFLDMILVSESLNPEQVPPNNWVADLGSFRTVVTQPGQYMVDPKYKNFKPRRFDPATGEGVSDHFPIEMQLLPIR